MAYQIQIRRDTASNWSAANPILAQGEMGYDVTDGVIKLGDGSTRWSSLASFATTSGSSNNDAAVPLTDASTITVDASAGHNFTVTIAGNRTMANPTNPVDGQKIIFQVTQGSGGNFTLSWGTAYEFSTSLPQPTLSTTAALTDLLGFIYNSTKGKWLFIASVNGFS